jgi:hypothetical protein
MRYNGNRHDSGFAPRTQGEMQRFDIAGQIIFKGLGNRIDDVLALATRHYGPGQGH